jgi:hypothetical protein
MEIIWNQDQFIDLNGNNMHGAYLIDFSWEVTKFSIYRGWITKVDENTQ